MTPPPAQAETTVPVGELISQIPEPGDGFPTTDLAEHWRLRGCGIACVRMILQAHGRTNGASYWSLIEEGLTHGAYCDRGWIHHGLVEMANRRGVRGAAHRGAALTDLVSDIDLAKLVIASVTLCFRGGQAKPDGDGIYQPGGHLVLVTGVRRIDGEPSQLRVHHPSATPANNLSHHWISLPPFAASFSGNYMAFDAPTANDLQ